MWYWTTLEHQSGMWLLCMYIELASYQLDSDLREERPTLWWGSGFEEHPQKQHRHSLAHHDKQSVCKSKKHGQRAMDWKRNIHYLAWNSCYLGMGGTCVACEQILLGMKFCHSWDGWYMYVSGLDYNTANSLSMMPGQICLLFWTNLTDLAI